MAGKSVTGETQQVASGEKTSADVQDSLSRTAIPYSQHMEVAVLGVLLLNESEHIAIALDKLTTEDFYFDSHRRIFRVIAYLYEIGTLAITNIEVREELERRKELNTVGGPAFIAYLTEGIPRNFSIENYIRMLKDYTLERAILKTVHDTFVRIQAGQDGRKTLSEIGNRFTELASEYRVAFQPSERREVLVDAVTYSEQTTAEVDWLVEGLIQRGGNGLILADPKVGKSFLAIDLALHLITGTDWLGCSIKERTKVALVSREDHHGETARRIAKIRGGGLWKTVDIKGWFYLNTKAQMRTFDLGIESDVDEIVDAFKARGIQFAIFDVFRRLWTGNENDNEEVSHVLAALTRIETEVGCQVGVIHHLSKAEGSSIFHRSRGSTAIEGFGEWGLGITVDSQSEPGRDIRKVEFYTKSGSSHEPIYYEIEDVSYGQVALRKRAAPKARKGTGKSAAAIMDEPFTPKMFYDKD